MSFSGETPADSPEMASAEVSAAGDESRPRILSNFRLISDSDVSFDSSTFLMGEILFLVGSFSGRQKSHLKQEAFLEWLKNSHLVNNDHW